MAQDRWTTDRPRVGERIPRERLVDRVQQARAARRSEAWARQAVIDVLRRAPARTGRFSRS